MASFAITGFSDVQQTLSSGETGYVGASGALVTSGGDAITASGSVQLAILGNVTSFGDFEAFDFDGVDLDMVIGASGSIFATSDGGLDLVVSSRIEVTNLGAINADGIAIAAATSDAGTPTNIFNDGTINGSTAISLSVGSGSTYISNSGTIFTNATSISVTSLTGPTNITNTGTIETDGSFVILTASGTDRIFNSGTMLGGISMGGGNDIYDGTAGYVSGRVDGASGDDTLIGGDFAETFIGGNNEDSIVAGGGNDTIEGDDFDQSDDTIEGGEGRDTYEVDSDSADLTVDLAAGLASGGFLGVDTLISIENVVSGFGDDLLSGNGEDNDLKAGGGNDTVLGQDGNDTLRGGNDDDRVVGGSGADVMAGNSGDDTVLGDSGDDRVFGGAGDDVLSGGDGDDLADGGMENDTIYGNDGNDTLTGDDGDDEISGGNGDDTIMGGDGADLLRGLNDNDSINGGDNADTVSGNDGNDTVEGNDGDDRVFGGAGDDVVNGGLGTDFLSGGTGADVFIFSTVTDSIHDATRDTISDFTHDEDKIDLSDIMPSLTFVASYTGTAGEVRYNATVGRLYIDTDGDSMSDFSVDITGGPIVDAGDLIL